MPTEVRNNIRKIQYIQACRHRSDFTTVFAAEAYPQLPLNFIFMAFKLLPKMHQESFCSKKKEADFFFPFVLQMLSNYLHRFIPIPVWHDQVSEGKNQNEYYIK